MAVGTIVSQQSVPSSGPSPDWIVGVSGLNLCLPNCSWTPSKVVDLYPYDAGTDNGITYMVSELAISSPESLKVTHFELSHC